ncbi:hypothetical protein AB0K05_44085 [Nonomuraea sp. NPDC049486]|uniref:hypothetical protein n=1 Tax=Nonomuraea sp. NPDC049486 TaxID=3155773 RepID=UPI003420398A
MDKFNLDDFVSLEELIERAREIIWKAMPTAREPIKALEAQAEEDGMSVGLFDYLLEIVAEVFEPAVEEDNKEVIEAFFGMCEGLLGLNSSLLEENVDDLVAKVLIRHHPTLISQSGLRLQELIATH